MGMLDIETSAINIRDLELVVVDANVKKWSKDNGSKDRSLGSSS